MSTTFPNLPTTSAGAGTGMLVNVVSDDDGDLYITMVTPGAGYANNETITINGCLVSRDVNDCRPNFTFQVNGITQ